MLDRRNFLRFMTAVAGAAIPVAARAHHGWSWTDSGDFSLTGLIVTARLGNPHGILTIAAEGEIWTAEVGQPWRNAAAGLNDDMLVPGVEVTLIGKRSADAAELRMKAEQVVIAGTTYVVYPERS
jgi:hypothetical protein